MKKIILFVTPFLFFGCKTMNYPGYNIKTSDFPSNVESESFDNVSTDIDFNHSDDYIDYNKEGINFSTDNISDDVISEKPIKTIEEESPEIETSKKKKSFFSRKAGTQKKQNISKRNIKNTRAVLKKVIESSKNSKQNEQTSGSNRGLFITLGVIFTIISIIVLWYVSILGGALMLIGGLGLWIAGAVMPKEGVAARPSSNRNQTEVPMNQMVDVVYLKNGGVRRGIIIEQVPGVSLKIRTNDGSVYVFKMDEISKITKE